VQYEFSGETNREAQRLFERALERDPSLAAAMARLSYAMVIKPSISGPIPTQVCLTRRLILPAKPAGSIRAMRSAAMRWAGLSGARQICPEQSAVVLRIFEEYAAGRSSKAIAIGLNRDKIPSPRGGTWSASTVNGNRQRQNGLLENYQYIGQVTYNKSTKVRDPATGKRVNRPNPPEEWKTFTDEALRIVPQGL
jgi:hypothetical protein